MRKRMMVVSAIVLYTLVSVVVFTVNHPTSASAQAAPAATGTIAYVVGSDSGDQIWLVDPNGSNKRQIYTTGVADTGGWINSLAWRPDAGELVFTSNYERWCSWYEYDVYAIQPDGSGYRRVTNGPACAALGSLPQGKVTLDVSGIPADFQVYVQGAPLLRTATGTTLTFDHVADFGNTIQPIEIVNGGYRGLATSGVDVKSNQTVSVPYVSFGAGGSDNLSAYGPVWKRDGSRIGYAFGCVELRGIPDYPAPGDYGQGLFSTSNSTVRPCVMAYGPTPATANQIVYYSDTDQPGFFRTTENGGPGTKVITAYVGRVFQIQWLPDASGFIYTMTDHGYSSEIYRYDFASDSITQLTDFSTTHEYARDFSLSPDGKTIVFERAPETVMNGFGGASDLWVMGIDGSNPRLFVANAAHPSWSLRAPQMPTMAKLYLPLLKR